MCGYVYIYVCIVVGGCARVSVCMCVRLYVHILMCEYTNSRNGMYNFTG